MIARTLVRCACVIRIADEIAALDRVLLAISRDRRREVRVRVPYQMPVDDVEAREQAFVEAVVGADVHAFAAVCVSLEGRHTVARRVDWLAVPGPEVDAHVALLGIAEIIFEAGVVGGVVGERLDDDGLLDGIAKGKVAHRPWRCTSSIERAMMYIPPALTTSRPNACCYFACLPVSLLTS